MEFEGDSGDDETGAGWVSPDDRLWMHPSEALLQNSFFTKPAAGPPALGRIWTVAAVAALFGAVVSSSVLLATRSTHSTKTAVAIEKVLSPMNAQMQGAGEAGNTSDIAERLAGSIVQLRVVGNAAQRSATQTYSGVIYRSDGHVLTTAHLLEGAAQITLVTSDGTANTGHVIGTDPDSDLAVIKIDSPRNTLSVAPMATGFVIRTGQQAIAIGSPFARSKSPSVAAGVISAIGPEIEEPNQFAMFDMIETDLPITSHWVGGELVNGSGAVIGITTLAEPKQPLSTVATEREDRQQVAMAIPIDVARDIADQLISSGRAVHIWLGIKGDDLDPQIAQSVNLRGAAVVKEVQVHSPAWSSGIMTDDVITAVDNQPVESIADLMHSMQGHKPGDVIHISILRGTRERSVKVILSKRP